MDTTPFVFNMDCAVRDAELFERYERRTGASVGQRRLGLYGDAHLLLFTADPMDATIADYWCAEQTHRGVL